MRFRYLLVMTLAGCASPSYLPGSASQDERAADKMALQASVCPNAADVLRSTRFPKEAATQGVESGTAVIEFMVAADGQKQGTSVVQTSHPAFGAAALEAAQKIRCAPRAQPVRVRLPFRFILQ
jgi:TonB family protein